MSDEQKQDTADDTVTTEEPKETTVSEATGEADTTEAASESLEPSATTETPEASEAPPAEADAEVKVVPFKDLRAGMTIRLHEKIIDVSPKGEKRERVQIFEGIITNMRGAGVSRSMTIRKVSNGVGVEKIFPLSSPNIAKIEVVKTAKVRRGNLSFLKNFRRKFKEVWMK